MKAQSSTSQLAQDKTNKSHASHNGVPAVSDASQKEWMEYVYMQKPRPTDVTGVDVTLTVIDPNGNTYDIGTATSDSYGHYNLMSSLKYQENTP